MSGRYIHFSPAGVASPQMGGMRTSNTLADHDNTVLCLVTEIIRATGIVSNPGFGDHDRLEHGSPLAPAGLISNGGMDLGGWGGLQSEVENCRRL